MGESRLENIWPVNSKAGAAFGLDFEATESTRGGGGRHCGRRRRCLRALRLQCFGQGRAVRGCGACGQVQGAFLAASAQDNRAQGKDKPGDAPAD